MFKNPGPTDAMPVGSAMANCEGYGIFRVIAS